MKAVGSLVAAVLIFNSGCAWMRTASPAHVAGRPPQVGARPAPDIRSDTQNLPPQLPRVELGQAVRTPPTLLSRTATAVEEVPVVRNPLPAPAIAPPDWQALYESTQRRPIQTLQIGSGDSSDSRVMLIGNLEGNDQLSLQVMDRIAATLQQQPGPRDAAYLLVRDPNPDGTAEHITTNARGVAINRNFPSPFLTAPDPQSGTQPASEVETRTLLRLFSEFRPTRVVVLQSGYSSTPLLTANESAAGWLNEISSPEGIVVTPFDNLYKAGSLTEFSATRLRAETVEVALPASTGAAAVQQAARAVHLALRASASTDAQVAGQSPADEARPREYTINSIGLDRTTNRPPEQALAEETSPARDEPLAVELLPAPETLGRAPRSRYEELPAPATNGSPQP